MLILIPDFNQGVAVPTAPSYHIMDTNAGLVQFVSGGVSSPGGVVFNGTAIYTPPTVAIWAFIQKTVTLGLMNGLMQVSFLPTILATVTSALPNPVSIAGGTLTLVGTNFQNGMTAVMDYTAGSALPICQLGAVNVIDSTDATIVIPATTAGTYSITLFNTDGSYVTTSVTTA